MGNAVGLLWGCGFTYSMSHKIFFYSDVPEDVGTALYFSDIFSFVNNGAK